MDADELKRLDQDYENKLAAKDDWFNGGYYSDINSGQAYRETLGFIDNVHELQSQGQKSSQFFCWHYTNGARYALIGSTKE